MDSHSIQSLCFILRSGSMAAIAFVLYDVTRDLLKILVTRLLLAGNDTSKGRDCNGLGETAMGNIALD